MNIGILGTGIVGQTIGTRLIELGHNVKLGSRTADNGNARAWTKVNGKPASHGIFEDAAKFGETLFNCIAGKWSLAMISNIKSIHLNNKVLIDVASPLDYSHGPAYAYSL